VLGAGATSRRAVSTRSAARDASEFLASAFSVGGAGRELRSEAHAQAERARHDPRSVDLANELFGDLNAPGATPESDAALDTDPLLGHLQTAATTPAPAASPPVPLSSLAPDAPGRVSAPGATASPRLRGTPKPAPANNQLSLKLGAAANEPTLRPEASSGRGMWIAAIALVGLAIGAAAFYLQRGAVPAEAPPVEAPPTAAAPEPVQLPVEAAPAAVVSVDLPVSSQPAGAEVSVDGAPAGTTPVTLKLSQGKTVQLSLHSPGFAMKTESINVAADMPARSVTLEPLAFELVVTEPVGATVKVLDKSVETPAPLNLGALFPATGPSAGSAQEVTVSVEKAGFQRVTRKLTRSDFREQATAMRAEISVPLVATGPTAKAAAVAKAPAAKAPAAKAPSAVVAKAASDPATLPPPEPTSPPEPESAAAEKPAPAPSTPTPAPAAPEKAEAAPSVEPPPPAAAPPPASTPDIPEAP
jgi:hypothetical protein